MAIAILQQPTPITSRDDLSFTGREANERGHIINWAPVRVPSQRDQWNIEYRLGEQMVAELQVLQAHDECEAYYAIRFAFNSLSWKVGGYGAEDGFAAGIAALAVVGMRALQAGAAAFDPAEVDHG